MIKKLHIIMKRFFKWNSQWKKTSPQRRNPLIVIVFIYFPLKLFVPHFECNTEANQDLHNVSLYILNIVIVFGVIYEVSVAGVTENGYGRDAISRIATPESGKYLLHLESWNEK